MVQVDKVTSEVRKAVGFDSIAPKTLAFISDIVLPTLNREPFECDGYRGWWHPVYGDRYVVEEKGSIQMVYIKSVDTWVMPPGYKLWGVCSEKKFFILFHLTSMDRIIEQGMPALAALRLEGKLV